MKRRIFLTTICLKVLAFYCAPMLMAETVVNQSVDVGFQQKDVNSPEAKFEEYGEVPNGVVIENYNLTTEGDKVDFELNLNKVRLDNQSADFTVEGAKFSVDGSWDQIPHLYSTETRTLYFDDGQGNLTIADPIKSDIQSGGTANFITNYSSFAAGAHIQELKTQTNKGEIGFGYSLSDSLKLDVRASETLKKGHQAKGLVIEQIMPGRNAMLVELAREVDFKTYDSSLGIGYTGKEVQMGFKYNFSSFKNGLDSLTADNPNWLVGDAGRAATGRISLEPDNHAHSVNFNGGLNLPVNSRFTVNSSFNYMRQNQALLPFTSNPFLTTGTLPTEKANAKSINWIHDLNLISRPVKPVDLGLRFHSDQLHNKTPLYHFPGVLDFENSWDGTPTENEHYSYRKNSLSGKAGWRVVNPLYFNLKYGREWINRDDRELDKNKEDTLTLAADYNPMQWALVRLSYLNARRRMDDFDTAGLTPANVTRYDISDRDRNRGDLMIRINPGRMNLSLSGGLAHDEYLKGADDITGGNANLVNQIYGLVESRLARTGVDVDYEISERLSFYTYYDYEQDKSIQRGDNNANAALPGTFEQRLYTRYDTGGVGLNVYGIKEIVDLRFGYDISNSKSNYDFLYTNSFAATPPPETRITKQNFHVKGKVRILPALALGLAYWYEKYDITDWSTDTVSYIPVAQRNVFLGDYTSDYKAHVVQVSANYKF